MDKEKCSRHYSMRFSASNRPEFGAITPIPGWPGRLGRIVSRRRLLWYDEGDGLGTSDFGWSAGVEAIDSGYQDEDAQ